jgi:hypothetical protein
LLESLARVADSPTTRYADADAPAPAMWNKRITTRRAAGTSSTMIWMQRIALSFFAVMLRNSPWSMQNKCFA